MDPFLEKIVLAVIALLLGLLAEPVKKLITRERKRLTYSITTKQIFGVDQSVPDALKSQIPQEWSGHLSQFRVRAENTGAQTLKDVNVLAVSNDGCQVKFYEYATNPPREVSVGQPTNDKPNEVRFPGIALAKGQSIQIDIYVRGPVQPELQLFWSGGDGNVEWQIAANQEAFGIERNLISAAKFYIYALIVGPLLSAIVGLAGIASLALSRLGFGSDVMVIGAGVGAGVGQLIGNLLSLYFYVKMVPHVVAVAKEFISRPHLSSGGQTVTIGSVAALRPTTQGEPRQE